MSSPPPTAGPCGRPRCAPAANSTPPPPAPIPFSGNAYRLGPGRRPGPGRPRLPGRSPPLPPPGQETQRQRPDRRPAGLQRRPQRPALPRRTSQRPCSRTHSESSPGSADAPGASATSPPPPSSYSTSNTTEPHDLHTVTRGCAERAHSPAPLALGRSHDHLQVTSAGSVASSALCAVKRWCPGS
jgi:hypothetical protein